MAIIVLLLSIPVITHASENDLVLFDCSGGIYDECSYDKTSIETIGSKTKLSVKTVVDKNNNCSEIYYTIVINCKDATYRTFAGLIGDCNAKLYPYDRISHREEELLGSVFGKLGKTICSKK